MLVEMHHDTRADSDPILALLCITFLRLIVEKLLEKIVRNFCILQINAMQGLASICELALRVLVHAHNILTYSCISTKIEMADYYRVAIHCIFTKFSAMEYQKYYGYNVHTTSCRWSIIFLHSFFTFTSLTLPLIFLASSLYFCLSSSDKDRHKILDSLLDVAKLWLVEPENNIITTLQILSY